MSRIYYDGDADLGLLKGRRVAVIGYGSQGHAQAQNLQDSGVDVIVGLRRDSRRWAQVEADGLKVAEVPEAAESADIIQILIPDEKQGEVYNREIKPHLKAGKSLMTSHGFSIHFGTVVPPKDVDVFMIAPKGPGHMVRRMYQEGAGVPALIAVHQDYSGRAKDKALAYAKGIGATRAGVLETTFREETETDLFGEQVVLCGGLAAMVQAGYETLVEAGYQPESAYFECLHELKLIVDLVYEHGLSGMWFSVSETAEYGGLTRGSRVVTDAVKAEMRSILSEIQDGRFATEWIAENEAGQPSFNRLRKASAEHPIEEVGRKLRAMMPFLASARDIKGVSGG